MILSDLLNALLRRWYVVLVGLVGTGVLCFLVAARVAPTYESTATATLVPGESTIAERGNPLMYLDGLILARDVLVRSLSSDDVREPVLEAFPGADFAVDGDPATSGPMIVIESTADTPDAASGIVQRVLDELPARLEALQDEVESPAADRISVLPLAEPAAPETVNTAVIRALGGVAGAGIVVTLIITGLVDGLIGGRRQRGRGRDRARPKAKAAAPHPPPHPAETAADTPAESSDAKPESNREKPDSESSETPAKTDLEPARMHQRSN
ncbi:hypothetical protein E1212_06880 [Jiangella ureilytica]|uniref:Polysaccharide chain length determinant N-terminal domain-containing protein n=1 Tax=Jiangella ureilytica TaxID=2530374 RepID=A0A4R4RU15_9ACTN|nr:hypothetical protein [Jiangella ureilytica]TDC53136.1 hypothetical protein E1212_06880 [Jiangella ureilytica]